MVALIIPYSNRIDHLRTLLPVVKRYIKPEAIFIAEQADSGPFNHAALCNAMFANMPPPINSKITDVIFHDVDMVPLVWDVSPCKAVAHLATRISTWLDKDGRWSIPYSHYCGGSVMVNAEAFVKLDGFESTYAGWGCEDDDFIYQYLALGLKLGLVSYDEAAAGRFERRLGILYHMPHVKAPAVWFERNRSILARRSRDYFNPATHTGLKQQAAQITNIATFDGCWWYSYNVPAQTDHDQKTYCPAEAGTPCGA
jgi:hypothetical protein